MDGMDNVIITTTAKERDIQLNQVFIEDKLQESEKENTNLKDRLKESQNTTLNEVDKCKEQAKVLEKLKEALERFRGWWMEKEV